MGERGTDVAREAADLVLLDDDFASIVRGVRLGRRIFDNLTKAMAFLFAVHVPIAGLALFPVLLGWPLVLLPAHIVFLELLIDPVCSVVFEAEAEEAGVMRRPPRRLGAPLFGPRLIGLGLLQGAGVLLATLGVYAGALALTAGGDDRHARAVAFAALVVADLGLVLANRSWSEPLVATLRRPNAALWWVLGGTVALLAVVLSVPAVRDLFHFRALSAADLALALAAGTAAVAWCEAVKRAGSGRAGREARPHG
jgi:Ca2+-transporting ATPase